MLGAFRMQPGNTDIPSQYRPEFAPMNMRPRQTVVMHPDAAWHLSHWYEAPREDPAVPEIYVYTDALSHAPGETVSFHASATAPEWSLQIWRDGAEPVLVHAQDGVRGVLAAMPKQANTLTGAWEDPAVGWPGATTVGVNGLRGIYAS